MDQQPAFAAASVADGPGSFGLNFLLNFYLDNERKIIFSVIKLSFKELNPTVF